MLPMVLRCRLSSSILGPARLATTAGPTTKGSSLQVLQGGAHRQERGRKMNSYELIDAALLKVADSLTTTRLGLSDGRIEIADVLDIFKNAKVVVQQLEAIAGGAVEVDSTSMLDLKKVIDNVVRG